LAISKAIRATKRSKPTIPDEEAIREADPVGVDEEGASPDVGALGEPVGEDEGSKVGEDGTSIKPPTHVDGISDQQ
jgi:hypothetical protein